MILKSALFLDTDKLLQAISNHCRLIEPQHNSISTVIGSPVVDTAACAVACPRQPSLTAAVTTVTQISADRHIHNQPVDIVVYGIGRFAQSRTSQLQLALALLMIQRLRTQDNARAPIELEPNAAASCVDTPPVLGIQHTAQSASGLDCNSAASDRPASCLYMYDPMLSQLERDCAHDLGCSIIGMHGRSSHIACVAIVEA